MGKFPQRSTPLMLVLVATMIALAGLIAFSGASVGAMKKTPQAKVNIEFDKGSPRFPVGGTALSFLDEGDAGKLNIVATGAQVNFIGSTVVSIIVRNSTSHPVDHIAISGDARDNNGKLMGVSSKLSGISGDYIESGALAFGEVVFQPGLSEDEIADFNTTVSVDDYRQAKRKEDRQGLTVTEFEVLPEQVVGVVSNDSSITVTELNVELACFDDSGALFHIWGTETSKQLLKANTSTGFTVATYSRRTESPCAALLVTGWGKP